MSADTDEHREFLPITQLTGDARALDLPAFRARHGEYFLVRSGPLSPDRRPPRPQRTIVMKDLDSAMRDGDVAAPAPGPRPGADLIVFPVRPSGRSPFPHMITVGRTKNNDVILSDIGVSKFHAFFKEESDGLFLQDAESRNGTFVDGKAVPTKKAGKAVPVTTGTKVKFGMLEFWLLRAAELQDLARRAG
jgi:hypothetical protein